MSTYQEKLNYILNSIGYRKYLVDRDKEHSNKEGILLFLNKDNNGAKLSVLGNLTIEYGGKIHDLKSITLDNVDWLPNKLFIDDIYQHLRQVNELSGTDKGIAKYTTVIDDKLTVHTDVFADTFGELKQYFDELYNQYLIDDLRAKGDRITHIHYVSNDIDYVFTIPYLKRYRQHQVHVSRKITDNIYYNLIQINIHNETHSQDSLKITTTIGYDVIDDYTLQFIDDFLDGIDVDNANYNKILN